MNQKKKTVALLYGGRGAEHDVSVSGAKYLYSLIDRRYEVYPILIDRDGGYRLCADISDREGVPLRLCRGGFSTGENGFLPVDVAFPLLHGDYGEDGVLQGALECADIPFVGCRTHAGALCSDKAFTKLVAESLGIPTADWILSVEGSATQGKEASRRRAEIRLGYPMFIKPARLGSSIGALPVWRKEEFDRAYDEAAKLGGGRVIIEELVKVRSELECGYFSAKGKELFTKIGEIASDGQFYDYDKKYCESGELEVSAISLSEDEYGDAIRAYSKLMCEYIGVRHLCRLDFFLTVDGRLIFNELNTMPGFTSGSLYPEMLKQAGLDAEGAVELLLSDVIG